MADFLSTKACDTHMLCRSKRLVSLADGVYNLINIPKDAFVKQRWFEIVTPYSGGAGGSALIGFTGNGETADPDGFMDATATGARAAGVKIMTDDAQPGSKGKWFDTAGGQLTITLADATDTVLVIGTVFMEYAILH